VCVSLENGERLWSREGCVDQMCQVDDRLFTAPYHVFDPKTGRQIEIPKAHGRFPERLQRYMVGKGSFCVSATHRLCGTASGYLFAWELATSEPVWYAYPEGATGAFGWGVSLMIRDGRLYYADTNGWVYCYEEVSPTDPVLVAQRAELAERRGRDRIVVSGKGAGRSSVSPRSRPKKTTASPRSKATLTIRKEKAPAGRASKSPGVASSNRGARGNKK
jgi:hypothetical protein